MQRDPSRLFNTTNNYTHACLQIHKAACIYIAGHPPLAPHHLPVGNAARRTIGLNLFLPSKITVVHVRDSKTTVCATGGGLLMSKQLLCCLVSDKTCVSVCVRCIGKRLWYLKCREVTRGVVSQHWRSFLFIKESLGENSDF